MKQVNDGYYVNRHSCFLLQYHLVLVTKYRRPVMKNALRDRMTAALKDFFARWEFPILQMEVCADRVHILFEASPSIKLSDFVNGLKTYTSRKIRREYSNELAKYYWKPYFWSLSYFVATVSDRSVSAVKRYIAAQDIES